MCPGGLWPHFTMQLHSPFSLSPKQHLVGQKMQPHAGLYCFGVFFETSGFVAKSTWQPAQCCTLTLARRRLPWGLAILLNYYPISLLPLGAAM